MKLKELMKLKVENVSTIIIYNPKMGEHESRTSRIRRSRKRPLGEAASSPSSMLDREKRQRRCGCAGAATHIFSSAGGHKIRAQQHRPLGGSPKTRERRRAPQSSSPTSLFFSSSPPSLMAFSTLDPPRGREPDARSVRWTPVEIFAQESRRAGRLPGSFSLQSTV